MDGMITKIEVLSLCLYRYNENVGEFDLQDKLLYDITGDHLDALQGGFDNDFYLTRNNQTYFFTKEKSFKDDKQWFILQRHQMKSMFQPCFMSYVEQDDSTSSLEMFLDYKIELPSDFDEDINNLSISFITNVN